MRHKIKKTKMRDRFTLSRALFYLHFFCKWYVTAKRIARRADIIRPTAEKYLVPNIRRGVIEKRIARSVSTIAKVYAPFFGFTKLSKTCITRRITESAAHRNGPKFAYPNGVRLKYEYVSRMYGIESSGAVIKFSTAPYGRISSITMIAQSIIAGKFSFFK